MRIHPEKDRVGLVLCIRGLCLVFCRLLTLFPNCLRRGKKWKSKTKEQKQKRQVFFRFIFKLTCQMSFLSAFHLERERERELISPCEAILRKLQSSIIHETSQNWTYHQVHTWEIKCYHPFQLLPLSVWKMCAGGSQQCEITPLGGQKKRQSAKDCHLNFHSMSPHLSWVYCTAQTQLTEISSFFFSWCTINCCCWCCFSLSYWETTL